MTYRTRIDIGVAVVVIAIGIVFGIEALRINPASHEAVGPRSVPVFLALLMIVLGAGIGLSALANRTVETADTDDFGFRDSDLKRVFAVIGAGIVYTAAFWAVGYLTATVLAGGLALWVFGVRSPLVIILGAIAAGIAYQFIFMGLMGLLDPRGELLDLRWLSRLITPGS
ncbi:MAG: tripartite tricarboxylate transporter TctB family protein [Pseudomonadota bacterium]